MKRKARHKKYRKRIHIDPKHVHTGQCYWCIITKQRVIVKILCPLSFTYKWEARNLKTGRVVKLTANRLRERADTETAYLHERLWQRERLRRPFKRRPPEIDRTDAEKQAIKTAKSEARKRKDAKDAVRVEAFHVHLDRLLAADKRRRLNETLDKT